ncbi:MAG: hypothetical protein Q4B86_07615 [Eubacteriales bacterium]|nr:hypothetical protein [Eubacteriales bacterium]
MDKYEFNIKVDQIKKRVNEGDYRTAMKIADSIDWTRVRNTNLLSMIADIYEKNGEIQEAKDKLLLAFERAPKGKRLLYKLTELSVKSGDLEEAQEFYNEFREMAPDDTRSLLLQYIILSAMHAPIDQRIQVLEAFNSLEPDDKWLYELAVNYDLNGDSKGCIRACDRLTVLFGAGKYSEKAMKLKQKYTGLSEYQRTLVEEREEGSNVKIELPEDSIGRLADEADRLERQNSEKLSQRPIVSLENAENRKENVGYEKSKVIRYENEDSVFEAYLRDHQLDGFSLEETKINYKEVMPDKDISYEETPVSDGLSKLISEDIIGAGNPASEENIFNDSTRVLDDECIEKLRSVIIKDNKLVNRPEIREVNEKTEILSEDKALSEAKSDDSALQEEETETISENAINTEKKAVPLTVQAGSEAVEVADANKSEMGEADINNSNVVDAAENGEEIAHQKPKLQARTTFTSGKEAKEEVPVKKHDYVPKYHMIIETESLSEGLEVAIDELKYIHKEQGINHPAAKTTAEKLNARGLSRNSLEKIKGKDFIVVGAGSLKEEIIEQIYQLIQMDRSGMIITLVDVPEGLDRLEKIKPEIFELCDLVTDFEDEYREDENEELQEIEPKVEREVEIKEELKEKPKKESKSEKKSAKTEYQRVELDDSSEYDNNIEYNNEEEYEEELREKPKTRGNAQVKNDKQNNVHPNIPESYTEEMDIDDFAQYCCQYADMVECSITGKSMLALYERIELMEEDNIPLNKQTAEDLIEEAADRAEKPPIGKRLKNLFQSKYDKNGLLILKEDDFIY